MSKKLTTIEFIEKAKKVHGEKYDYSKVKYNKGSDKVLIICKDHGEFYKTPKVHLRGQGCPKCSISTKYDHIRYNNEQLLKKFNEIHDGKYNYILKNFKNVNSKIEIICPIHLKFEQRIDSHLQGSGCPKCAVEKKRRSEKEWIKLFNDIYDFKYEYKNISIDGIVTATCKIHGDFEKSTNNHKLGQGCPKCALEKNRSFKIDNLSQVIKKFQKTHGLERYNYSTVNYENSTTKVFIVCNNCGNIFKQASYSHIQGKGCPKCANNGIPSICENEIINFIKLLGLDCIQSDRSVLDGKEIDILIPDLNLAIEYNGLYWHSDKYKTSEYHLEKLKLANSKGVNLIQIFEDEWLLKKEIVKSRILNIIGKTPNKIWARKCEIREVKNTESFNFLDQNHIQGGLGGSVKFGLYYKNELVSLMTFGNLRKNLGGSAKEDNYELLRFCNKLNTNVVGGASKLWKYFLKNYNPEHIISYADKRWSSGNLYFKLGFEFKHNSNPNYFYVRGNKRENRFKYRKSELIRQGFDPLKTEREIMKERGYLRIYDCGAMKFEWKKDSV